MADSLEFRESLPSTILEDNDKEQPSPSDKKVLSQKVKIIIVICSVCATLIIIGLVLFFVLKDDDDNNNNNEPSVIIIPNPEFQVTIEVFKYRKGRGEKEHENENLGLPVYFLGEDFKCDAKDFEVYLEGKEIDFSKNFTFYVEGNYTITYKLKKQYTSFENLFRNCYYINKINMINIKII